jgi:hypothetical protein
VPFERGLVIVAAGTPPETFPWSNVITVTPGAPLLLWLAWGAREPLSEQITFTVQLFDDSGQRVAQIDQEMGGGAYPTTMWHTWMDEPVVVDEFPLEVPTHIAKGRYLLRAGAYESASVIPLHQTNGDPWVELAIIEVEQGLP